jgi:two-component sensor histidine kinase
MMQLIEIPSLKRSSSETRLLLREYSHRINNEFALAIGAISVAAAHSAANEPKAVLAAVQDQLQNYAQVHHALQLPEHSSCIDAAAYLQQLCRAISRSKLDPKWHRASARGTPITNGFRALLAVGDFLEFLISAIPHKT